MFSFRSDLAQPNLQLFIQGRTRPHTRPNRRTLGRFGGGATQKATARRGYHRTTTAQCDHHGVTAQCGHPTHTLSTGLSPEMISKMRASLFSVFLMFKFHFDAPLIQTVLLNFIKSWVVASILEFFICMRCAAVHCLANNVLGISSCIQEIEMLALRSLKTGVILLGDTNQLMDKASDWNMYETKLKKFCRWVLHTANKDCDGGEDDVRTLPEGCGDGSKDGSSSGSDDHDGSKDGSSSGSDDHDGHKDHGAASEDRDDEIIVCGPRVVQFLAVRGNFSVGAIYATDWIESREIYWACEEEVQESFNVQEGMVDLILTGPCRSLEAYGALYLDVFAADDDGSCTTPPITGGWGVSGEHKEVVEYTQTIDGGLDRKLEIMYLVIQCSAEAIVEVKLNLKDLGSGGRSVYGSIKASAIGYGSKSVYLFSCERGRSLSVPCGSTWDLPLSLDMIALPYFQHSRPHFKLQLEVDLKVITTYGSQEEDKNLKFYLEFTRRTRSLEREADGDQVEVNVTWILGGH